DTVAEPEGRILKFATSRERKCDKARPVFLRNDGPQRAAVIGVDATSKNGYGSWFLEREWGDDASPMTKYLEGEVKIWMVLRHPWSICWRSLTESTFKFGFDFGAPERRRRSVGANPANPRGCPSLQIQADCPIGARRRSFR